MLYDEKKNASNIRAIAVIIGSLFVVLTIYFIFNYGKWSIYNFDTNSELFRSQNGIAYFTPQKRSVYLYNLRYFGDSNLLVKKVKVGLYYKDKNGFSQITANSLNMGDDVIDMNDYLSTFDLYYEERAEKILTRKVDIFFNKNVYLIINYTTDNNAEFEQIIKVNANKISNDALYYYN